MSRAKSQMELELQEAAQRETHNQRVFFNELSDQVKELAVKSSTYNYEILSERVVHLFNEHAGEVGLKKLNNSMGEVRGELLAVKESLAQKMWDESTQWDLAGVVKTLEMLWIVKFQTHKESNSSQKYIVKV